MTELFQCGKSKTTCCSPKSAIKDQKTQVRRNKIKQAIDNRNDDTKNPLQYIDTRPPGPQIGPVKPDRPTLDHPVTNKYVCGVKGTYR